MFLDESLDGLVCLVVADLLGRRLHQVGAGALEGAGDASVEGELGEADGGDDAAGRVG